MSIHNVFSWPILTFLLFSQIGKPIPDTKYMHLCGLEDCGEQEGLCHDPFPKLSLTQPLQPPFGRVYSSDAVYNPAGSSDWWQPHPTGPYGPTPVAIQP